MSTSCKREKTLDMPAPSLTGFWGYRAFADRVVCRDWKTWKMKMVMEKSWNMKNWPKVMEFCLQSWNFTNFAPKMYQICVFFCHH